MASLPTNLLRSELFLKLKSEERRRYLSKIALIGGVDPFTLKKEDLIEDTTVLPLIR